MNATYMKKVVSAFIVISIVFLCFMFDFEKKSIEDLREQHADFLKGSPFKETLKLTKKERKHEGLPPNKYYEREWELTMNPATGIPEPDKVLELQKKLRSKGSSRKTPGDALDNQWIERGPNNVGGRTRVLLFDPNDIENKRVFAGAVSGGLWVNSDITDENSAWSQVTGVPSNMNISCITVDPRNTNIWYVGTGEQYTFGAAVGDGVYKSSDGGTTWSHLNIVAEGQSYVTGDTVNLLEGIYYINDIIAWDNGTNTEIFVGVGSARNGSWFSASC